MQTKRLQNNFFFGILLGLVVLAFFVFHDFLGPMFVACVIGIIFFPLYNSILRFFKGRETLSATISLLIIVILIFAPIFFISVQIFHESINLYGTISQNSSVYLQKIEGMFSYLNSKISPDFYFDLRSYLGNAAGFVAGRTAGFLSGTMKIIFNLFITIVTLFFFLRDGKKLKKSIVALSPLPDKHDNEIFLQLKKTVQGIVGGSLMLSLLQGILIGIGFLIFGVPNPTLWGSVGVVSSLLPAIGPAIVLIPGIFFLFVAGHASGAIGLAIWGTVFAGLIGNFLSPIFLSKGTKMHPLFIFLSVLGGISLMGPIGFLVGPIVVSLLLTLLEIYQLGVEEKNI